MISSACPDEVRGSALSNNKKKLEMIKKRAIIYTRVSTDEQNNGYSPADQKDKLYRYCENNNIAVVGFYHDDESGKSFDRPEWKKIMDFIKKNKNTVDYIYFLKWDRFSRNAPEAYAELAKLKKLNVEAKALEQPLELEIPEQKLMLALYLTAPEVDNDRRSLNIFHGIRRGKKEGRWLGACPRGYKNTRNENNRPVITPEGGVQEELVKLAFKEFASGKYSIEELRKKLFSKGLKCNRNSFWMLLRNKAYIGKVLIPAYKNEPEEWIQGNHIPLIDESTFYSVQDILEGRKKNLKSSFKTIRDEFPLRGILICPKCGLNLTASSSKGKMGRRYPYYHCSKGCNERQKAEKVNDAFERLMKLIQPRPNSLKLFNKIANEKLRNNSTSGKIEIENINKEIVKQRQRISNAEMLLLDAAIDPQQYKDMRIQIEEKISQLTRELNSVSAGILNIGSKLTEATDLISNLFSLYNQSETAVKRRIISSIFPTGLTFDENKVRTLEINKVISKILSIDKAFGGSKIKKHTEFGVLSLEVVWEGIEPPTQGFSVLCSTN
jgi:site-specific DNA recombinase